MNNLQELTNQLDNIKEKLTDKEYKDLMELTQKIYKKDKRVKLVQIDIEVLAFKKYDNGHSNIHNIAPFGYEHDNNEENDDDDDDLKLVEISIDKPKMKPRIIELNIVDAKDLRPPINVEKNYVEEPFYNKIKEDKFRVYDETIFIYLEDIN